MLLDGISDPGMVPGGSTRRSGAGRSSSTSTGKGKKKLFKKPASSSRLYKEDPNWDPITGKRKSSPTDKIAKLAKNSVDRFKKGKKK